MPWGYLTALALTFIFSFALGIFTLLINPRSRVHQLWFLTTMGVSIWSAGVLAMVWFKPGAELGLLLSRILHAGATMLPIFFFHFVLSFLQKEQVYHGVLIFGYGLAAIFAIIFFTTKWILTGMAPKVGFATWLTVSQLYWAFVAYFLFYVMLSFSLLYREYQKSDGIRQHQIMYIMVAAIIGYGGGVTNFLPQTLDIYPFGTYLVPLYPFLITYGIFLPEFEVRL